MNNNILEYYFPKGIKTSKKEIEKRFQYLENSRWGYKQTEYKELEKYLKDLKQKENQVKDFIKLTKVSKMKALSELSLKQELTEIQYKEFISLGKELIPNREVLE